MVRYYKPKKRVRYESADLQNAVNDVIKGIRSVRNAAKTYNVAKSTLHDHVTEKHVGVSGGKQVIPVNIEEKMAQLVDRGGRMGMANRRYRTAANGEGYCRKKWYKIKKI